VTAETPPGGMRLSEAPMPADAPDHPNVAVIRRFVAALDGGDRTAARAVLAEDVIWAVPGRSAVAGTHTGPDAVLDVDAMLRRLSGGTLHHDVLIWLAAGPHAHAVTRQTATRDGVVGAFDRAFVFTLDDGLITEVHAYTDDLYAFDAFWHPAALEGAPVT
jgi:uncharacterized protein